MRRRGMGWWFPAAVLLVVCAALPLAWASGAHHGAGEAPTINWWVWDAHQPPMGWFLLDFAIFLAGLIHFARKPLGGALAERHDTIKRSISEAASAHAKAASRQALVRDKLARMESEAQGLAASSQTDGQAEHDQIVADAKAYAARLQQDSSAIAAQEQKRAEERLRRQLLQAALLQASEKLTQELDSKHQQEILERAIGELETSEPMPGKAS